MTSGLIPGLTQATTALANFIEANKEPISGEVVKSMKEIGGAIEEVGGKLHYLKDLEDLLNKLNNLHPGTIVRNALPDWAKPNFNVPVLPGVDAARGAMGLPPLAPRATKPQMYSEYDLNQSAIAPRGSLGTGSITGGWRHSENVEDLRSNEAKVADEASRKETYDNTAAERDNTDQLRKLIEVMSRGNSNATIDFSGGGGGGGFGAGQGPMFRGPSGGHPSGVGPGSRARPGGVHNVPVSPPPSVRIPSGAHPGAKVTPGPTQVTPTPIPPSSIPAPNLMPQMQNGGVIRDPATVVDNATGRPVASVAEAGPEAVIPFAPKDPEIIRALKEVSAAHGVSPTALSAMINLESQWDPRNGTGSYHGLTQMGAATFREAGGTLGGLTYPQYLGASEAQQIRAYDSWLNHYKFDDQLQQYGIDPSKMSTAQQAAMLQGFQFAPAGGAAWKTALGQGQTSGPTTASAQARALGDTSIGQMTNYYTRALGKNAGAGGPTVAPGATPPGWPVYNQVYKPGGNAAQAVDSIMALEGMRKQTPEGLAKIREFLRNGGQNLDPAEASFCAASVNSALVQAGMQPMTDVNKNIATQFLTKEGLAETGGQIISSPQSYHPDQIQKGDVGVYTFGHSIGDVGGHVGMYAGPYDSKSGTVPFASANTWLPGTPPGVYGAVHTGDANPKSMYVVRLPQGSDSKSWDEKFPKAAWHPNALQAVTRRAPSSQILPPGLVGQGGGPIDLSQPGLTNIPGVGGMLGGTAAKSADAQMADPMTEGSVLKASLGGFRSRRMTAAQYDAFGRERAQEGRPLEGRVKDIEAFNLAHHIGSKFDTSTFRRSTNIESRPVYGPERPLPDLSGSTLAKQAGVDDVGRHTRLGHGRAQWKPGQGGQTNVPGNEQLARLAGMPPALRQQLDIAQKGQQVLGINSAFDYANDVVGGRRQFSLGGAATAAAPLAAMAAGQLGGAALGLGGVGAGLARSLLQTTTTAALGSPESSPLGKALMQVGGGGYQPPAAGGLQGNAGVVHKVEGTGTINVNIKAPRGVNVNAESGGLFKKVNLNRGQSMQAADERGQVSE